MPANARGYAVCRTGWSGTITVDDGSATVVTPSGLHSAWSAAARVPFTNSSYAWELTFTGAVRIYHGSGTNFDLTFSSAAIAARLGFSNTSYTGAATYTAEATAPGTLCPYAADALDYRDRFVHVDARGVPLTAQVVRPTVAALESIRPVVRLGVGRVAALQALQDWSAYLATPARVDVAYGSGAPTLARHDAESLSCAWAPGQDYATLALSLSEVLP
jgi:hypothetical protein